MTEVTSGLPIARAKDDVSILPRMANRHGLIAGATGTGKTVTLRVLAERFSSIGVPVFMADVKGDLSGFPFQGGENPKVVERVSALGLTDFRYEGFPVVFWDVFGQLGHPLRTTVSEMGPLLLSRILNLNEIQAGVLTLVFKIADDNGLLLLDLKDLRAMAQFVGDHAGQFTTEYGNVSAASIGAIQRNLLALEQQGGDKFFGEPALNIQDFMQTDRSGKGMINLLAADRLMQSPKVYATLLLWMLSELFEQLPEVGDPEKPNLVFFFDEAHLLFEDRAKGPGGQDRAGRATHTLQGCRCLLRHAKPSRYPGDGPRTTRKPRSARAQGLYAEGSEEREGSCRDIPCQPETERRESDYGAGRRRGACLDARRQRHSHQSRAGADLSAHEPARPYFAGGTE